MLASSIPDPVSSSPNLSDQYKAISRNVEMVALDLARMLFVLTKLLIAMSAGRYIFARMLDGMVNQVNDIALLMLPRHRPPSGAHPKWVDAQSQDLTMLPNAAIAANQIISVSVGCDTHILNPVFRGSKFLWCAKMLATTVALRATKYYCPKSRGHC